MKRTAFWLSHFSHFSIAVGLFALAGCGSTKGTTSVLPLRSVRLYETGVGYFQRSGSLDATSSVSLPVPASHVDDALKTLVVLGTEKGTTVQGVEFTSGMSRGMARALAGLPMDADKPITYRDLLASLRGTSVEIAFVGSRPRMTARVLDIEGSEDGEGANTHAEKGDKGDKRPLNPLTVVVVGERSEIVRLRAKDIDSLRPTDPAHAKRLDNALDALSARGAQTQKALNVLARGGGAVTLGYIAEAPIFRTTYRLVMGKDGKTGTLQAWALLHNDTDEDWQRVNVELANGRPDSFLFPLAAPRYSRRSLVHPENELSTVPQLFDRTADGIWGDHVDDAYGAGGIGLSGIGEGGGGRGEGIGLGHGSGSLRGSASMAPSSMLEVGNLAAINESQGVEAGALFVYTLGEPLSLRAHGSALVPILSRPVEAEAIAWLESPTATPRAAVRFVNSTTQTLPVGTVAFFGDGGFSGEAGLDRMKPYERRFLQFGADLDIEVKQDKYDRREEPKRLVFEHDRLVEHFLATTDTSYSLENRSGSARAIYLSLSIGPNATLKGADASDFDTAASHPVAVFRMDARSKQKRNVVTVEGIERAISLTSLSSKRLGELASKASLPAADRAVAAEAEAKQKELEDNHRAIEKVNGEIAAIEKDLERLREHLKAMSGNADRPAAGPAAANPFVTRILEAEDRLAAARKRHEALVNDTKAKVDAVRASLAKLTKA